MLRPLCIAVVLLGLSVAIAGEKVVLRSVREVDAKQIAALIAELGSDSFEKREAASTALRAIGRNTEAQRWVAQALKTEKDPEKINRLSALLPYLDPGLWKTVPVSMEVDEHPLKKVLAELTERSGKSLVLLSNKYDDKKLSFKTVDASDLSVLEFIAASVGLSIDDSLVADNIVLLEPGSKISFVFNNADVRDVLNTMCVQSPTSLIIASDVRDTISISVENASFYSVLREIVSRMNYKLTRFRTFWYLSKSQSVPIPPEVKDDGLRECRIDQFKVHESPTLQILEYLSKLSGKTIRLRDDWDHTPIFSFAVRNTNCRGVLELMGRLRNLDLETANGEWFLARPEIVSVVFNNADVRDVIKAIAAQSKGNIIIGTDVKGTISMRLDKVAEREALFAISAALGLELTRTEAGDWRIDTPKKP